MTKILEQAFRETKQAPPQLQDSIGQAMIDLLHDEQQWDESFNKLQSEALFSAQAQRVREQIGKGQATPMTFDDHS